MGKKAVEIVDLDVKKLIEILNQALSEEWLAYYQYWIGARVMSGPMHGEIEKELYKHANEELSNSTELPSFRPKIGRIWQNANMKHRSMPTSSRY